MQKEEYANFSKAAGLLTQNERTQVYGFDKSIAQKAAWKARKAPSGLTNPTEADIIKARAKRLSSYGLVSLEEFVSESVAEYQNGSPRATAMSVVEILLKGYE